MTRRAARALGWFDVMGGIFILPTAGASALGVVVVGLVLLWITEDRP